MWGDCMSRKAFLAACAVIAVLAVAARLGPQTRAASGVTVTYPAGWNLVGAPQGTTFDQATNPLYALSATSGGSYTEQPNNAGVASGQGYWAYFGVSTAVVLN